MDAQYKNQLFNDLKFHLAIGRRIFPLSPGSKIPPKGVQWTRRTFTQGELEKRIRSDHNLAWALGSRDLVLDLDPRHRNAAESFRRLCKKAGIAPGGLFDLTATVNSGGSDHGQHYYMRLPENVKVKTTIDEYPDLHFKRIGGYVVLPGSLHPSGRYYDWDYCSPYDQLPMMIPDKILELLRIDNDVQKINKTIQQDIHTEEIYHYLNQLHPRDFRSRQSWIELAFMVHSAIGESGRDIFLAWSSRDDQYYGCEEKNIKIWESIKDDKQKNLTFGSLIQLVLDKGGKHYRSTAKNDFKEEFENNQNPFDIYIEKISKLPPNQNDYELKNLIREAHQFGIINWENKFRDEIAVSLGINKSVVDKIYKQIDKEIKREQKEQKSKKIDYPERIATKILKEYFENGRLLIHAINQQFYQYIGTHWQAIKENEITKLAYETSLELKQANKATHEASSKVKGAVTALIAKTAKLGDDVFDFAGNVKPIINCANGELHIDVNRGIYTFKEHSPESHLLHCLSVSYDSEAICPVWDDAIRGIFRNCKDPNGVIRHLYEAFGYMIQPQKDIPSWFLWIGGGNNGKSMVFKILKALIGEHAILPRAIQDLADTGRSNHAIASLVGKLVAIDDDADIEKVLPSSTLKKLSESQTWEANPKHKDAFNFKSSVTPLVLVNGWPPIRDITKGMLRKIYVFPFNRHFKKGIDEDTTLKQKIKEMELSGLLNHALKGLQRLRKRGYFDPPIDCREAKREWLSRSNFVLDWLRTKCVMNNDRWTSISELYRSYNDWALQNHIRYIGGQTRLENQLYQRGLKTETRNDERGFLGISLR